jgi:EmrB/QacA subfamily drug resistance transporter
MTRPPTNPWLVLVLVCLAQFMVILDATVVNVALPSIQADLDMSEADLQWVVNAYTLVFGGFLLLGGRAGDLIGRKRIFLAGVAIFTFASFLDGLANSSEFLILARGLQGLGGALVSPAALSIVMTTFEEGPRRAKALGVWAGIASGGAAVGLLLGGILTDAFSWPWIFFVNIPVGIATFLLALRFVPESRDAHARTFDVAGAVTVTGGLVALVYAIVKTTDSGWTSAETIVSAAIALVLLTAFVLIEQRREQPLVRLSIFRVRTISASNVVMLLVGAGLFAMFFFNSLYIQRVLGYSPLEAGLAFLPFTVGIGIGAGVSAQLAQRIGVRPVTAAGMVLGIVGLLLLARVPVDGSYVVDLLPSIVITSIGMGATFVPVTMLATSGVEGEDAGLASGLFNTSQQIGGALGLAILSTVAVHITDGRQDPQALVDGFHGAFVGGAVLIAVGLVLLFVLLRREHLADVGAEQTATAPIGNL